MQVDSLQDFVYHISTSNFNNLCFSAYIGYIQSLSLVSQPQHPRWIIQLLWRDPKLNWVCITTVRTVNAWAGLFAMSFVLYFTLTVNRYILFPSIKPLASNCSVQNIWIQMFWTLHLLVEELRQHVLNASCLCKIPNEFNWIVLRVLLHRKPSTLTNYLSLTWLEQQF